MYAHTRQRWLVPLSVYSIALTLQPLIGGVKLRDESILRFDETRLTYEHDLLLIDVIDYDPYENEWEQMDEQLNNLIVDISFGYVDVHLKYGLLSVADPSIGPIVKKRERFYTFTLHQTLR